MSQAERERKIQDFAESQGSTAAILEAGFATRAIFQKAAEYQGSVRSACGICVGLRRQRAAGHVEIRTETGFSLAIFVRRRHRPVR